MSRLVVPTGTKGYAGLLSRLEPPTGTKGPHFVPVGVSNREKMPWPPADPASRWTRDKSHLLSRAQRLPGQMAWKEGLFCSSARFLLKVAIPDYQTTNPGGNRRGIRICSPRSQGDLDQWEATRDPVWASPRRPRHDGRSCMGRRRPPHGRTPLRSVLLDPSIGSVLASSCKKSF